MVEEVLDAAAAWEAGDLPLAEINALVSGHDAYDAIRCARLDDPRRASLMALLNVRVARSGVFTTNKGAFTREEIADNYGMTAGTDKVIFPVKVVGGKPVYPRRDDKTAVRYPFRVGHGGRSDQDERDL